jgi:cysteine-rich repeat protein
MKLATVLSGGALLLAIIGGCAAETKAKTEKLCTPGAYVFCRCQDRQEGAKLCNETGDGFGKCEPCETDTNPEIDPGGTSSSGSSSGDPFPEDDAGPTGDGSTSGGKCGDGIVQAGEDCDDRNTENGDGCDTSCKLAGNNPVATNNCPGLEVHVWGGAHKPTLTGSTTGSGDRGLKNTCPATGAGAASTGKAAPDRVFKVVAHKTGSLKVTISDANYNVFLYAVGDGACSGSELVHVACMNGVNGNGNETLSFPVDAGKQYHVFVDGAGAGFSGDPQGNFRVTFEIP